MGSCAHFTLAYAHNLSAVTDLDTVPCGTMLLYACTPVPQPFPTTVAPAAPPQPSAMACSPLPVGITVFVKTISGRKQSLGPIDAQITTALHVKHMLRELEVRGRVGEGRGGGSGGGDAVCVYVFGWRAREGRGATAIAKAPVNSRRPATRSPAILQSSRHPLTSSLAHHSHITCTQGAPVEQLRLIFAGRQLADDQVLATYGVGHGAIIHSVLQLRGGGTAEGGARGKYGHI